MSEKIWTELEALRNRVADLEEAKPTTGNALRELQNTEDAIESIAQAKPKKPATKKTKKVGSE